MSRIDPMESASTVVLGNAGGILTVDFGPFLDAPTGLEGREVARELVESFERYGFVYLKNYGMPQETVDGTFEWSKRFFAQPTEVKRLAPHPGIPQINRGWTAPGVEAFSRKDESTGETLGRKPDAMENFSCGGRDDSMLGKNIWLPERVLPGFNEACQEFYWKCYATEIAVLRAIAVGLELEGDRLSKHHSGRDQTLRLLHYPPVPALQVIEGQVSRIGAHSDFGTITLLFQDDIGGLQVEEPGRPGKFIYVPPVPGAMIVNAGDFLQQLTNDRIRSAVHRVQAPPGMKDGLTPDRYSIAYFCSTDFDIAVECLPGTSEHGKKREPITAGEYIMKKLEAVFAT
ncbi:thymine dioxygenase [Pilatotrama ljubarskyi]|nr:thymine dioxygenase [Pilatotrama ljubarskyi]